MEDIDYWEIKVKGGNLRAPITISKDAKIHGGMTANALKKIVADRVAEDFDSVQLIFATRQLTDEQGLKTLEELDIEDGSTLYIIQRVKGGHNLELKILISQYTEEVKLDIDSDQTVLELKEAIYDKNKALSSTSMELDYVGVNLKNDKKLSDYNIISGSTLTQAKSSLEKVKGLILGIGEDVIQGEYAEDGGQKKAKMPCGHLICTDSMTQLLRSLIDNQQYKILCPGRTSQGKKCNQEWPYPLCRKIGVLTLSEKEQFEEGFAKNLALYSLGAKQCPTCKDQIINENVTQIRVYCVKCRKNQRSPDFCWICLKTWIGTTNQQCGNIPCGDVDERNAILQNCGTKVIEYCNVNAPKTRACPCCYTFIEHKNACKHMECPNKNCKKYFCFVCLSVKDTSGKYSTECGSISTKCPIAAIQVLTK